LAASSPAQLARVSTIHRDGRAQVRRATAVVDDPHHGVARVAEHKHGIQFQRAESEVVRDVGADEYS